MLQHLEQRVTGNVTSFLLCILPESFCAIENFVPITQKEMPYKRHLFLFIFITFIMQILLDSA